jgi:CubicO group peptidase (beta-lactamase class C family)
MASRKLTRRCAAASTAAVFAALAAASRLAFAEEAALRTDFPIAAGNPDLTPAWPETVGVDSTPLIRLSRWIREQGLDVRSLLLVKDDKLIFERYSNRLTRDHNYELYSVTKAVAAILTGMLIDEGKLRLDDKIAPIIAKWRPEFKDALKDKQDIEVRHILSMSSGLHYDFKPKNDPIYYEEPDRLRLAVSSRPKAEPGKGFEYTDINPILTAATLSAAAGMPLEKYAADKLFAPLGMRNHAWDRADKKGLVSTGWGLRLRPIDMAKVGLLVLHGGRWQGKQLVSAAWIKTMTSPSVAPYYGYYWWINNVVEGEPEYDAMGFKGQFIVVLPERDAVVVMTSMLSTEGGLRNAKNVQLFRQMMREYILPALGGKGEAAAPEAIRKALLDELRLAAESKPEPGTEADPTDTPRS